MKTKNKKAKSSTKQTGQKGGVGNTGPRRYIAYDIVLSNNNDKRNILVNALDDEGLPCRIVMNGDGESNAVIKQFLLKIAEKWPDSTFILTLDEHGNMLRIE